jgi:adenine-specific DNA-methyltransferase
MANVIDHLDLNSEDGTQINLEALYQIAPSAFTEVKDSSTGKVEHKVNFDVLRQLLGDKAVDGDGEMYQFTWVGKNAARAEAAEPTTKTLRPVKEDSLDWDNTKNVYIEGDNLEVLKLLQRSYLGKVKMIYIDPPYNTGNDFVYHDDFARTAAEEDLEAGNVDELGNRFRKNTDSNGKFHSDWCSMIYSRLLVARSLLKEDGVIFISIDDNEVENLKKICNEVFGEHNFVSIINWKGRGGRQDSKYYAVIHEYIVCYAKDLDSFQAGEEIKEGEVFPKFDEKVQRNYKVQLLRKWGSNSLRENRPNLYYPIAAPDGTEVYPTIYNESGASALGFVRIQGRWRHGASTLEKIISDGRVEFQKNKWGEWVPYEKIYEPLPGEENTKKYTTWIDDISNGTDTLKSVFGKAIFDYSKSPELILKFLKMANVNGDDLVLDFFSGSATTAHAVMKLNAENEGDRKYIMVQLPEVTDVDSEAYKAGYKNICEIGKERIRRAGKKIKEESPLTTQDLDTGFRVYRLDESNYENVALSPKEYKQDQLDLFANNIKADRNDLDLLYGSMLAWGVSLDLPMETETVDGKKVYIVNEGDLVACFDDGITDAVVQAMADKSPLRILFRDSCFARDDQKINIYEQFKQALNWTDDEAFKNIKVI